MVLKIFSFQEKLKSMQVSVFSWELGLQFCGETNDKEAVHNKKGLALPLLTNGSRLIVVARLRINNKKHFSCVDIKRKAPKSLVSVFINPLISNLASDTLIELHQCPKTFLFFFFFSNFWSLP